ncbi:hypothetical protein HK101_008297 [Irineochytrium annulatum]|nr:hypothetical protein HK101_008297 [Irineochytrium annulatum]
MLASSSPIIKIPMFIREIEVCGLHYSDRGRRCPRHTICGKEVATGSFVRIKHAIQETTERGAEPVLQVYLHKNGFDGCMVGFLPAFLIDRWSSFHGNIYMEE